MSNVLLSFVGRNRYEQCVYGNAQTGQYSTVVRFVQEAICQLHCRTWTADDRIVIFLTPNARAANWLGEVYRDDPDDKRGLEQALMDLNLKAAIHVESISEGMDEVEIRQNFKTVFDALQEGDLVYLDITNAFRSIPVFAAVLSNYAEFLKGVRLKSIFYGIFERLGSVAEVRKKYPNPADRRVPILDLKSIVQLQDWTSAANDFLTHGNTTALARMASVTTQGNKSLLPKDFGTNLSAITGIFSTVRGKEMMEGDVFQRLRQNITDIEQTIGLEPLVPILHKVRDSLDAFKQQDIKNGFRAIEWCIDHQLVQQGITLFRETIVSYICHQMQMDFQRRDHRGLVEKVFQLYGRPKEALQREPDYEKIRPLFKEPLVSKLFFLKLILAGMQWFHSVISNT